LQRTQGIQHRRPRRRFRFLDRRRTQRIEVAGDVRQLRDHAPADIGIVRTHRLVAQEVGLDLRPARLLFDAHHAAQLGQL